ncbi:MAG: AsmA-like C-terminal domain-containing protein, partial [Alphaproteobacteria bacterium]|nr:AsmA-like C-terminal domain-containing protein [Alphaproteobacteria bacterium]
GSIPLVGRVLAGKDGSVFGTNYRISGSIDKPEVEINPLSTLAPNSIKELFSE